MTRTATGATLAVLEALEPEAKAAWEEEILNLPEAIQASRAITDRRLAGAAEAQRTAVMDQNTINLSTLSTEAAEQVPSEVRGRYLSPDPI